MKTLHLVRHAKSSWDEPCPTDHDRPLSRRGERDLARMSTWFAQKTPGPVDQLVSSSATRAMATARAFASALGRGRKGVAIDRRLYEASAATILQVVAEVDDAVDVLAVFGHNPGMSDLAHQMAGQITHLPTCAVLSLKFEVASWVDLLPQRCIDVSFETPKTLRSSVDPDQAA
jgi:phosphohistidine phosphatase